MVVIIAPETDVKNELVILNQLLETDLEYYHLRKPNKNYDEHCAFLDQINSKYHNKIVVHYFHELMDTYNLKGIHFQEKTRRENLSNLPQLKKTGKTISSSFHEMEEIENCTFNFDYHLLSPVFSSISKEGYNGKGFDVNHINKKIIGMGGVTTSNLESFINLGYHGVGVLGGIWNSSSPLENFKLIHSYYKKLETTN